jgi:hypothetical protein
MLAACTCSLLSAGFGTFLQVSANNSHWLEDFANFTPTPEENDQYSANYSLWNISIKPNPLLTMNNYTPLMISRNGKLSSINRKKLTFCIIKSAP